MIEQLEDIEAFICKDHKDQIPLFLEIADDCNAKMQCQVCIAKNSYKTRRLISIGQIFDSSKKTIIANWPPLEDDNIYEQMEDLLSGNTEEPADAQEIHAYFEQIKSKIIKKLDDIQKTAVKNAKMSANNNLLFNYNEMAKKEQLRLCLLNPDKFESDMQNIISESFKQKKENTQKLQKAIDHFEERYQFDMSVLDKFLTFSMESLSDIEKIITQQINKNSQTEIIQKNTEHKMVQFMDDLGSTIKVDSQNPVNQFSIKSMVAIEDEIKKNLKLFAGESRSPSAKSLPDFDKLSSISSLSNKANQFQFKALSLNHIRSSLQQRIAQSINQKQCKHSKAIQQNGYSFKNVDQKDTYNIGFIEAIIDPQKSECFSIHVKNLQNWIGIGLVEKEKINNNNNNGQQSKPTEQETISGYYMLSHNGYVWQQSSKKSNTRNGQFIFKSDDIVTVSLIGNSLIFEKQNYSQRYELQITLNENTCLHPGFILYSQGDEIEFVCQ